MKLRPDDHWYGTMVRRKQRFAFDHDKCQILETSHVDRCRSVRSIWTLLILRRTCSVAGKGANHSRSLRRLLVLRSIGNSQVCTVLQKLAPTNVPPFCSNLPKTCRSVLYTAAKSGPARTGFGQKRVLLLQGWSPLLGRRPRVRLRRLGCRWCSKCHAIDTDICGGYTCATYLGTRDRPLQRSQRAC